MALAAQESRPDDAQDTEATSAALEARVTARGMVHASRILTRRYHLVMTNPPYLGAGQHGPVLKEFCEAQYKTGASDLANVFLERCLKLCVAGGVVSFVMPQNWLFLKSYQNQREYLLRYSTWNLLVRLGSGAFETITGEVVNAILLTVTHAKPTESQTIRGIDASLARSTSDKAEVLTDSTLKEVSQTGQLSNPDSTISLDAISSEVSRLGVFCSVWQGLSSGDDARYGRSFFEVVGLGQRWKFILGAPDNGEFTGRNSVLDWPSDSCELSKSDGARIQGLQAIGKRGFVVAGSARITSTAYFGEFYGKILASLIPKNPSHSDAIWAYLASGEFETEVRKLDSKILVTPGVFSKVPFDLPRWQDVAAERYPNGLPKPYSDDPTQWIFHGHPQPATDPLQVAVARLLGYRWPAESDAAMELSSEARAWIARCKDLDSLVDDDGILCLPAVRGEAAAVDRLRALLAKAFGADWTPATEARLLSDAACDGLPLAQWLRDKFFEQHVARFHKRPFIWHVWDGHKDGFSALLNYHTLTRAKLQTLIHTYLGDWITQQRRTVDAGGAQAGEATLKLAKAEALKLQLEAIAQGEKPFDIFVRWKPLAQQPIGWEPDLNDGVRMNIRPFVEAGVLRIPRAKLGIHWKSDRGADVPSAPWFKLGPTYGEPEGTRINDHHLSLAEKQAARQKAASKAEK